METIKDIPRGTTSPNSSAGSTAPLPIQGQFGTPSVLKFLSMGICLLGVILAVIGLVTFIIPLTVTGVIVLALGGCIYMGRGIRKAAEINPTPEPTVR